MSQGHLPRQAIVEALDELDERGKLSYEQRTSWERPYPPSFVEKRLDELQRDQWWAWCMLAVVGGIIVIVAIGLGLGWSRSALVPALLIFGIPQVSAIYQLVLNGKLQTLYELLHRLDCETEPAASVSSS